MSFETNALFLFAGLTLSGAVLPPTQESPVRRSPADDTPLQVTPGQISLADLIGADVVLEASTADKAGGKPGVGSVDSPKGKVVDVVLSTEDGQIACAALSVGKILGADDRVVLVSSTALAYTMIEKRPGYVLHMVSAEIQALPEFDIRKDGKDGLDRAVERARGLSADAGGRVQKETGSGDSKSNGTARTKEAAAPAASLTAAPIYVLASQLEGCDVSAIDAVFGKVHDAAVDVRKNTVGCLFVARGDAASDGSVIYVVPFRACQWKRPGSKSVLTLGKTSEQLKAAPEYKKPEQGLLTLDQMKSADGFFGSGKGGSASPK